MRFIAGLLVLLTAGPLVADVAEDVRQTEISFAKAFADRDREKFFSFVADDATFVSPWLTLRGKPQVVARWSRFFEGPQAPFSWGPDRVALSADGSLALSSGPVFDAGGEHAGTFSSTWRKQKDGSWKIIFDGSGPGPVVFEEDAVKVEEGEVTTADGVRLRYRKAGRSPLILIVPLDSVLFDSMRQLSDIATVVAYDLRNRGRSGRAASPEKSTIDDDVRDLEAVRAHLKIEKFVPVGFSYLGKMVMLYAASHPERIQRVIQLGPVGNQVIAVKRDADFGAPKELLEKWQSMEAAGAAARTPREFCEVDAAVMSYLLIADPAKASRVPAGCSLENEWPVNRRHLTSLFPSIAERVLSEAELKKITAPVLTIHGVNDRNAPHAGGLAWAQSLPDARLVTLDRAAHAMWIDDPVGTFGAIRAFLRGEEPLGSQRFTRQPN